MLLLNVVLILAIAVGVALSAYKLTIPVGAMLLVEHRRKNPRYYDGVPLTLGWRAITFLGVAAIIATCGSMLLITPGLLFALRVMGAVSVGLFVLALAAIARITNIN